VGPRRDALPVNFAAWNCAALVTCAALLAVDRAFVHRAHWPLAALLGTWAVDPMLPASGGFAVAWTLALPALSAAVGVGLFARSALDGGSALVGVLVAGAVALHRGDPATAAIVASVVSLAAQALAAVLLAGRRLDLLDRCALVLLAGDVAALGGPLGDRCSWALRAERWWIVQWQGALVAAVLVAMHLHARRARA
jgi:hypothetical protein